MKRKPSKKTGGPTPDSSFSLETKRALCDLPLKNDCCAGALLYGLLLYSKPQHSERREDEKITALHSRLMAAGQGIPVGRESVDRRMLACSDCRPAFVRGAFISCGTVANPGFSYHLELVIPGKGENLAAETEELLAECGLPPKRINRAGIVSLYYKESESIEDFLNFIGAQKAAFEMMNKKIYKELRNNANRLANCDAANIDKSVSASLACIGAIESLTASGRINELPEGLRYTAGLRLQNPDVSIAELARLHSPEISKPGVYHRLKKIVEFSNDGG